MTKSSESNSDPESSEGATIHAAVDAELEDLDKEWIKEIYFPDLADKSSSEILLKYHFECAGYLITRIETAPTHPVIVIRAIRTTAPRIAEYKLFFGLIREVVSRAGFCLRKDELTVDQKGARILVAFPSGEPPVDFMEILQESQQDLANNPDLPL